MAEQGFTLISDAFTHGGPIPNRYTCEGSNEVPPLRWIHPPEGTRSYALIMEDPDAPAGTFTHWVLANIPQSVNELGNGAETGTAGKNDFQQAGYGGPCPPPHHGKHRYFFRLHALDVEQLDVPAGATREKVEQALQGHVLETTELMGTFQR